MTRAFAAHRFRIAGGLVAGPRATGTLPATAQWFDASHPLPDRESERAGRSALELAGRTRQQGALVVLLSGGASSMLAVPAAGLSLSEKAAASGALLAAGVPIAALNCVRRHLSAIKGGRLAAAAARTVTLALSDVHAPVEDDPAAIGSGVSSVDPTTFADALEVVRSSGARVPEPVLEHLARGARGEIEDTPKPGSSVEARLSFMVIGNRRNAMAGAIGAARELGYAAISIDAPTSGEARDAGQAFFGQAARQAAEAGRPVCVVAAGETTVRVRGRGRGGRNQEFVLATVPLVAASGMSMLVGSIGTDGVDGPTDAAGAVADNSSEARARAAGLSRQAALEQNGAYDFFLPLGDLIRMGPTGTNVGDLHLLLVQ